MGLFPSGSNTDSRREQALSASPQVPMRGWQKCSGAHLSGENGELLLKDEG